LGLHIDPLATPTAARVDNELLARLLAEFAPPPKTGIVEWCENRIILPASNAEPGPLKYTAYQRGLVEAFADLDVETLVFMLASQSGKSTAIDSALLYTVANDPGPALIVHPSEGKALDYVRNRLDPLIASTPTVRALVGKGGRTGGGSSVRHKIFPGGSVSIGSSYNPDDLAARSVRYLLLDEIDRFARSAGTEGDPVQLAIKRTRTFQNRKIILASTPTAKNASRIAEWFFRGTQERFYIPCPECGALEYARFDQLKWQDGKPHTAHLTCDHCGHAISERERLVAIELGAWLPTAENPEPHIRSFHATELVSRFSSLESVAAQYEESKARPEKLRVFHNTVLAETHDFGEEYQLDASELQLRAEPIAQPLPASVEKIILSTDTQLDRLEASIIAFGADDEAWVISHHKLMGSTDCAPDAGPYAALSELWGRTSYRTKDGRLLPVAAGCIDGNYHSMQVAQFVASQRRKQRNMIAVRGVGGFDKPLIRRGNTLKGITTIYHVGVDSIKASLKRRLAMTEVGPGFIHLAETLDPTYFEQLANESLQTRFVRGREKLEFVPKGPRSEALDCLTYATALARLTKATTAAPANKPQSNIDIAARLAALNQLSTRKVA
jgi:phage terminase large subunit GpA-like protein